MSLTASYKRLAQGISSASSSSAKLGHATEVQQAEQDGASQQHQAAQALALAQVAEKDAEELHAMLRAAAAEIAQLRRDSLPTYVAGDNGLGVLHICGNSFVTAPLRSWRTRCGWSYGQSNFRRYSELSGPFERQCEICFRNNEARG